MGILCAVLLLPLSVAARGCAQFNRDLKFGMEGEDVRLLQQFLNTDARMTIANSGLGSPGQESTYFGLKTKAAVMKFQELYSSEVLVPAGLSRASGYFGALSRTKLAGLCEQKNATPSSPQTTLKPQNTTTPIQLSQSLGSEPVSSSADNIKPFIMFPADYAVHQGQKLVVFGGGFTPTDNTMIVGTTRFTGLSPTKNRTLEVTIPADALKGKFDVTFLNAKGESNRTFVVVTDPNAVAPKIVSYTPTSGPIATSITITGENFSKDWNEVYIGAKPVTGLISPDGKTLTLTVTLPVPGVSSGQDVPNVDVSAPMWFYIVNPSGISNSGVFTLKF